MLDVGNRKQLFIDRRFIDAARDVELTVNPPVKLPGPVLTSEHPWEAFSIGWSCVLEDDGLFKLWYAASDSDQWSGGRWHLCYATSANGRTWEKPELGLVEYGGSKRNNIVLAGLQARRRLHRSQRRGGRPLQAGRAGAGPGHTHRHLRGRAHLGPAGPAGVHLEAGHAQAGVLGCPHRPLRRLAEADGRRRRRADVPVRRPGRQRPARDRAPPPAPRALDRPHRGRRPDRAVAGREHPHGVGCRRARPARLRHLPPRRAALRRGRGRLLHVPDDLPALRRGRDHGAQRRTQRRAVRRQPRQHPLDALRPAALRRPRPARHLRRRHHSRIARPPAPRRPIPADVHRQPLDARRFPRPQRRRAARARLRQRPRAGRAAPGRLRLGRRRLHRRHAHHAAAPLRRREAGAEHRRRRHGTGAGRGPGRGRPPAPRVRAVTLPPRDGQRRAPHRELGRLPLARQPRRPADPPALRHAPRPKLYAFQFR